LVSHVQKFTHSYLVHRSLPSDSGFSCVAPLASPMPPGVKRRHEGGTLSSSPLGWELDGCPHPLEHQVIEGDRFHLRLPSSWIAPSFGRTGHSPRRTALARVPRTRLSRESGCMMARIVSAFGILPTSRSGAIQITCRPLPCARLSRTPLAGRHSGDSDGGSVALALAGGRRSRGTSSSHVRGRGRCPTHPLTWLHEPMSSPRRCDSLTVHAIARVGGGRQALLPPGAHLHH
jgi:hypothetical protein